MMVDRLKLLVWLGAGLAVVAGLASVFAWSAGDGGLYDERNTLPAMVLLWVAGLGVATAWVGVCLVVVFSDRGERVDPVKAERIARGWDQPE